MKNLVSLVLAAAASIVIASTAAAASKPIKLELKLPSKAAVPRPEMAALLTAGPVSLVVVDARGAEDPDVVGAQRSRGADVYVWRASKAVIPSVAEFVAQMLGGWSVRVAPEAEFGLRFELMKYYVTEKSETFGSTYHADVRLKVAFVDRAGGTLWTGEASGESKRSGVDARASVCNEALSIALRSALASALSSVKLETAAPAVREPAVIEPDALLADLARLKAGGVADDVLVTYVEQRKLSRPLTVDEILHWKDAGIPDAAIKAATK